jgi:outer membrane protein TolC
MTIDPFYLLPPKSCRSLLLIASLLSSPWLDTAKANYRINGIPAPQVRPSPLARQLEDQLRRLQQEIDGRSRRATLDEALEMGLLHNPQLAAAYAEIQGQQWNLIAVRRQWYPSLSASSSTYIPGKSFESRSSTSNDNTFNETSSETSVGLTMTLGWTFFGPSRAANINSALEGLKRQHLLFDISARNLVLEIQDSYFSLQEQIQLIQAYEKILSAINRQVKTTEVHFNNGMVSIADVEQIRTQQYSTLSTLIGAYSQLIEAASLLAQTMALPPGKLALPSTKTSSMGNWEQNLQSTIEQALKLREEIKASQAAAASASWTATALLNTYWPSFNLGASVAFINNKSTNTRTDNSGNNVSSLSNKNLNWSGGFGLGFNWQIFDGGINASQAQAQKASARQSLADAASSLLSVTREVEQSYATYVTSQLTLQSSKAQLTAAQAATTAVQARYQVGITDISSLVVALNQEITAANNYANAERTYQSALARLYRSSARWPDGTRSLLEQRTSMLQKN